jgi:hypothetical protein
VVLLKTGDQADRLQPQNKVLGLQGRLKKKKCFVVFCCSNQCPVGNNCKFNWQILGLIPVLLFAFLSKRCLSPFIWRKISELIFWFGKFR